MTEEEFLVVLDLLEESNPKHIEDAKVSAWALMTLSQLNPAIPMTCYWYTFVSRSMSMSTSMPRSTSTSRFWSWAGSGSRSGTKAGSGSRVRFQSW